MLDFHVVKELNFVELHDVEHFLSLLQLLAHFQILHSTASFDGTFGLSDEFLQYLHTFFTLTHTD